MSVASLNRFTVPIDGQNAGAILQPKLKYRFRTIFQNFGASPASVEMTKNAMNITRPTLSHESIVLDVYNSKINIIGKHQWDNVTVTLRDDSSGIVTKLVGEQLQKQMDHFEQASAVAGIDYKFILKFDMLDGGNGAIDPVVLESWELYGSYLENVAWGDMDWSSSEPAMITLTVKYDNALQVPIGDGLGVSVPRNSTGATAATG